MILILRTQQKGFTMIELVSIIVIISIIAAIAIPRYNSYKDSAQLAALKGTLGNVRIAINNFYLNEAVEGEARYPTITEIRADGGVMAKAIPENPYSGLSSIAELDNSFEKGDTQDLTTFGWNYTPHNGEFWANSLEENSNTY